MKRALTWGIGAIALAGTVVPAAAADLGARPITKAPPVAAPPPVTVYNWTSCYIGANGGGDWGRFRASETIAAFGGFPGTTVNVPGFGTVATTNDHNSDGSFLAGGQVGCQWQAGNFVFGIEGDADGTDMKQRFVAPAGVAAPFLPGDTLTLRNDLQASVRGRLGYAFDRWLVYATGGVAFADVRGQVGFAPAVGIAPTTLFSNSQTLTGATVGGGVEYAFLNNLSLGAEYRFSSFGHEDFNFGPVNLAGAPVSARTDLQSHEVTARLNWHFNLFGGGAPGPSRY